MLIGLVGASLAGTAHAQGRAEKENAVTFQLSIPEQAKLVETCTQRMTLELGKEVVHPPPMRSTSDVEIRRTADGFSVILKPRMPNEPLDPRLRWLEELARRTRLRYDFDTRGNLAGFYGADKVLEEAESMLPVPPAVRPMMKAAIQKAVEEAKDIWSSRYAGIAGLTLRVGERRTAQMPMQLIPDVPPVPATVVLEVKGRQPCPATTCVVFGKGYFIEHADALGAALLQFLNEWMRQLMLDLGGADAEPQIRTMEKEWPTVVVKDTSLTVERVVDPRSLMVYKETRTRTYRLVAGEGLEGRWTQVATCEYAPAK